MSSALAARYRVERQLGEGGMATVYLARDLRHDRSVAIKVLHPDLAAVIGGDRFLAEIRTTANLQHPHILGLIDSGEVNGVPYYVMPFVDGESLRDRLQRERQLPIDSAVRIAREVADALAYAHAKGVVHRDIKPENIMLQGGHALVADFGIALAVQHAGKERLTQTGLSLGTPAYMSPEQAMGERTIDARTDVYALGAVTAEMLTGEPPFTGATAQAIVARVLTERPPSLRAVRDTVPAHVEHAVHVALAKLPADRWENVTAFASALVTPGAAVPASTTHATRMRPFLLASGWVVAGLALAVAGWSWSRGSNSPPSVVRLRTTFPAGQEVSNQIYGQRFAFSHDGKTVAYVGIASGGQRQLWVRSRDALDATALAGTLGAAAPVFSPDGEWIAFVAEGKLRKIRTTGGPSTTLSDSANNNLAGAAWLGDGNIVFTHTDWTLHRVSENGGSSVKLAGIGHALGLNFPRALPGNAAVLVTTCSDACDSIAVQVVDLRDGSIRSIAEGATGAWYSPTGHVVYVTRTGVLQAVPFDVRRLNVTGPPVPVMDGILVDGPVNARFAMSPDGTVMYVKGVTSSRLRLVRVTRQGVASLVDSTWSPEELGAFALSPDSRQLAIGIARESRWDLWIKQMDAGGLSRLTTGRHRNWRPKWLSDGRVSWISTDSGFAVLVGRPDGTGGVTRFPAPASRGDLEDHFWSPDMKSLILNTRRVDDSDILVRSADDTTLSDVASAPGFMELQATISPDGRWVAYVSTEDGTDAVYVRPFPDVGRERRRVSTGAGVGPAWSSTGRELFYVDPRSNQMIAVPVTTAKALTIGRPQTLFSVSGYQMNFWGRPYDVGPDGQWFLLLRGEAGASPNETVMIFNWLEELKQRVPR